MDLLEQFQRRATKIIRELEHLSYKKKRGEPKRPIPTSLCLGSRRPQTDQYIKAGNEEDGERLSAKACSDRTRGIGFKLKEDRFMLDTRKSFFTIRMLRHWDELPSEFSRLFTSVNAHICAVCICSVICFISAEYEQSLAKLFVLNENNVIFVVNIQKII